MYKIDVTFDAGKSIKKLPAEVKKDINSRIVWLSENADIIIHKKLKGYYFTDMYKLRVGNYRVIYSIEKKNKVITVELAGHRKNIYKQF